MRTTFQRFGQILKTEEQDDGTIKVYGIASTGSRDGADEIVAPEAMKAALPDYSKFPSLREMHDAQKAAGTVLEAYVDDDGATQICAHVVDPIAVKKVQTGVYKGFSIGGKVLARDTQDRTIIRGLRLIEISLVDTPCNPDAILTMWKAEIMTNPTSEQTIAKAKELAHAAGRKNYKNYLYKARETLIAEALAKAAEAEEQAEAEAAAAAAAEASQGGEPGAPEGGAEQAPEGGENGGNTGPEGGADPAAQEGENGANKSATTDPVNTLENALSGALAKAEAAAAASAAPVEEAPDIAALADELGKAGTVIALIGAKAENDLAKGMYTVSRLAEIIDSARSICTSMQWEAEDEKDGSTVPAQMAQAVADLCGILLAAAKEETAELLANYSQIGIELVLPDDGDAAVIELAAQTIDLVKADTALMEKAGARNSKADATKLQNIHDHAVALGATCGEGKEASAKVEELAAENERLTKALSDAAPQVEELTKRFGETVDTLKGQITDLTKRLETVENTPAAPKTATNLAPIAKGADAQGGAAAAAEQGVQISAEELVKVLDTLPEAERGAILLKMALANPIPVAVRR